MSDYDWLLIARGARAMLGVSDDWSPPGDLGEQAWNEALEDAEAVLDACVDDIRAQALRDAQANLAAQMRGFPKQGAHTRAGWAVNALGQIADRIAGDA